MSTYLNIDGNKVYISSGTNIYNNGYVLDLDDVSARNCLLLIDKLKRIYFDKLKE